MLVTDHGDKSHVTCDRCGLSRWLRRLSTREVIALRCDCKPSTHSAPPNKQAEKESR